MNVSSGNYHEVLFNLGSAINRLKQFKSLLEITANGSQNSSIDNLEDSLFCLKDLNDSILLSIENEFSELTSLLYRDPKLNCYESEELPKNLSNVVHSWITDPTPVYTSEK
jgi:hypothetical protein